MALKYNGLPARKNDHSTGLVRAWYLCDHEYEHWSASLCVWCVSQNWVNTLTWPGWGKLHGTDCTIAICKQSSQKGEKETHCRIWTAFPNPLGVLPTTMLCSGKTWGGIWEMAHSTPWLAVLAALWVFIEQIEVISQFEVKEKKATLCQLWLIVPANSERAEPIVLQRRGYR